MNLIHKHKEKTLKENSVKYYCPMHCEGDKTYDEPGDCPVCGMHLVPDSGEKSEHVHHMHKEHHMKMDNSNHNKGERYAFPMHCEGEKLMMVPVIVRSAGCILSLHRPSILTGRLYLETHQQERKII